MTQELTVVHKIKNKGYNTTCFHPKNKDLLAFSSLTDTCIVNLKKKKVTSKGETNGDNINSIKFNLEGDVIYTAGEDNRVVSSSYPEFDFISYISRNQMAVQMIELNQVSSIMAIASLEDEIKVIFLKEENKVKTLKGHEGGVIAVSFDPKGNYLASAGRDGNIKIWNLKEDKETMTLKNMIPKEIIKGIISLEDGKTAPILYKLQWNAEGKYLIVPAGIKGVFLIEREKWIVSRTIKDDNMDLIYMIAYSNKTNMIVAADTKRQCFLFDTETSFAGIEMLGEMEGQITDLTWSPHDSLLIISDTTGVIKSIDTSVPTVKDMTPIGNSVAPIAYKYNETMDGSMSQTSIASSIDSMDGRSTDSAVPKKLQKNKGDLKLVLDNEAEDDEEDSEMEEAEDDIIEDYEEDILDDYNKEITLTKTQSKIESFRQKPFQTGSSEFLEKRRFLAHNQVGLIASFEEKNSNYIEIEFNDTSRHKNDRFTEYYSSHIAALGDNGAVFANKAQPKSNAGITFRSFNSWSNETQWRINMDEEEDVETVAVCNDFVAASTKTEEGQYFLRIYTINGIQLSVLSFPDQIISMCGYKNNLAVLYYENHASDILKLKLFNLQTSKLIVESTIPNSKKSKLTWIGFSLLGQFCTYDSFGYLKMYTDDMGGQWQVILDNSEYKDEHWMVQVNTDHCLVVFLEPEGQPIVVPRPPLKIIDLSIPFAQSSISKSEKKVALSLMMLKQFENNLLENFKDQIPTAKKKRIEKMEIAIDKELISIIYECVTKNNLGKALEASQKLIGSKSISMAKKIANDHSLIELSDRINTKPSSFSLRSFNQETSVETAIFKSPVSTQSFESRSLSQSSTKSSELSSPVSVSSEQVESPRNEKIDQDDDDEAEVNFEELSASIDQSKVKVVTMGAKPKKKKKNFESFTPKKGDINIIERINDFSESEKREEEESKKRKREKENAALNPPKKTKVVTSTKYEKYEEPEVKKSVTKSKPLIPVGVVKAKKQKTLDFSSKKVELSSKTAEALAKKNVEEDDEEEFGDIEIKM
eukprot:gene7410-11733_t